MRERLLLLVALLREQDADVRRLWRGMHGCVVHLLAEVAILRGATRALDRCTDELAGFEARCAAGDVDGAVLALRAWIHRIGT